MSGPDPAVVGRNEGGYGGAPAIPAAVPRPRDAAQLEIPPLPKGCGAAVACTLFAVGIVLLSVSFAVVEPRQYGIVYNRYLKKINRGEANIYDSGRHIIGPVHQFVHVPRGLVTFQWTNDAGGGDPGTAVERDGSLLSCWSKNGQIIELSISLQVRIVRNRFTDMHFAAGSDAYSFLRAQIVAALKNKATSFETDQYFTDRLTVKEGFIAAISEEIAKDGFMEVYDMQLRKVAIPPGLEEAILQKLLFKQSYYAAVNRQQVSVNEMQREEIIQAADAKSNVTLQVERATGDLQVVRTAARKRREIFGEKAAQFNKFLRTIGYTFEDDSMDEDTSKALNFFIHQRLVSESAAKRALETVGLGGAMLTM
jgi:hypothetical protein